MTWIYSLLAVFGCSVAAIGCVRLAMWIITWRINQK